jgi:hypothetical protein
MYKRRRRAMNYVTTIPKVRDAVMQLLGTGFSDAQKVHIGVTYSQTRKLSIIIIEVSPTPIIHSLIFFYSRNMTLSDVLFYRNKRYVRIGQGGKAFKCVDFINRFLLNKIPRYSPYIQKKIEEEANSEIESKDNQIQHLKDMLRIQRDTNQSLRNQIKALRAKRTNSA